MCQFKSALVLKDRIFLPDYDNHDKMLHELGIEDNFTNASKVFVRVELSPEDGDIFSDVDGWELKVDQDILPDWWNEAERLPKLKELVERWIQKHTISGEYKVADGVWLATGIAMVKTCGNATVKACDGATVTAYDSATVTAYGSATVKAYGSATVTAYDSATVTARGSATVTAYDRATVTAYDRATVTAYGSATVRTYDRATVTVCGSATVKAHNRAIVTTGGIAMVTACGSATVTAYDSATVTAYDRATVTAYGSATVIIPKRFATDGVIKLNDDSVCINHKTHTIRSAIKWKQEE